METKARFFCLCASPAIDATVSLPCAPRGEGEIFKDVSEEENVGGKTVNVARWLAIRGADVVCGGLLGEDNDRPFVREMERYGIADGFLRVPGATRRNEMVVWPGGSMKLNRAAFPGLCAADGAGPGERMLSKLAEGTDPASAAAADRNVAIVSGSLPPAFAKDFYAKAIAFFRSLGMTTVLDASGDAMRFGLDAEPDLIKPNADECADLIGFVPKTPEEFVRATEILRRKARHVIISDGASGAWFDGEFVPAPPVEASDTTAAGDTLLAEYCWRMFAEGSADAGKWAVAAGSAACTMPGGAPPDVKLVERLKG